MHNGYLSMCNYAPAMQSARRGGVKVSLISKLKSIRFPSPTYSRFYAISWKRGSPDPRLITNTALDIWVEVSEYVDEVKRIKDISG
jgi:hypothetical protein